jgi:hypothetical protein
MLCSARFIRSLPYLTTTVVALGTPPAARAHRDDYIDETFVYQTLGKHELELEVWGDARGGRGHPWLGVYTGAFEGGLTERWMLDGAVQLRHDSSGIGFERARAETRYRFAEEGTWPIDVALSLEYELEGTGAAFEHTATPRLILSRDIIADLNTTLNLDVPVTFTPEAKVSFAYAVGIRYPAQGVVRGGIEFKHQPFKGQATIFPQLWFALPAEITIKLGVGLGLAGAAVPLIARGVFEVQL